jgi:hypothetical protein
VRRAVAPPLPVARGRSARRSPAEADEVGDLHARTRQRDEPLLERALHRDRAPAARALLDVVLERGGVGRGELAVDVGQDGRGPAAARGHDGSPRSSSRARRCRASHT